MLDELKEKRHINRLEGEILCWKIFVIENKLGLKDLSCWRNAIVKNEKELQTLNCKV